MTSIIHEKKQPVNVLSSIAESRIGKYTLLGVAVGAGFVSLKSLRDRHPPAITTMTELQQQLGHIPKGVEAITPIENSDIEVVDYVVQPDKQMVSAIDADIHAIAPAQNAGDELPIMNTYLSASQAKAETVPSHKHLRLYVDKKTAKLMPNPEK